jgi:tRNA(Ile)-lysidine synthase
MNGSRRTVATPTPPKPERRVAVAYSGGRDSTALLHATLAACAPLGVRVVALHVHHGLNEAADAWEAHARARCAGWAAAGADLQLRVTRLAGRPPRGESVEAWARRERYAALRRMTVDAGATLVLLAHHRRDQAETLLLQALRGAGPAGLAGMPREVEREGVVWARPWLDVPRERIEAYVRRHDLDPVEDPSNEDPRFARNRLRAAVWPALVAAFPDAEAGLAASAAWAGEAAQALSELAAHDLAAVAADGPLDLARWVSLSTSRRSNALRAWLRRELGTPAPATLVLRLLSELPHARTAQWLAGTSELVLRRGQLCRIEPSAAVPLCEPIALAVPRAGRYRLPQWGGQLEVTRVPEGGVSFARLAHLELRSRAGAERFQAGPGRPPRSLKKQFQAADVPPWQRDGPLVYSGGLLVFVPGLGVDARAIAAPGEPQAMLRWTRGG